MSTSPLADLLEKNREWSERNQVDEALARGCAGSGVSIELARAETVVDL